MRGVVRAWCALAVAGLAAACSAARMDPPGSGADQLVAADLVFDGSCDYRRSCAARDGGEPRVRWLCPGVPGRCADGELWLSAPAVAYCGKVVKICNQHFVCSFALV